MTRIFLATAVLAAHVAATGAALADHTPGHVDLPVAPGGPQDLVLENRDLVIKDNSGNVRVRIDSVTGSYFGNTAEEKRSFHIDQPGANLFLGGSGSDHPRDDGDIVLFSETATDQRTENSSIHLDGGEGNIFLGGGGETGQLVLRASNGAQRVFLDSDEATAILGNGDRGGPTGSGRRGRLLVRNASGDSTAVIDGASGGIRANQIVSRHNSSGGARGIDSASVVVESPAPAISLRDTTGGNENGWYVQAGSTGQLLFQAGTTSGLGNTVMTLDPDGAVCLGACN